jgi:DNA repair exonuclease SbcCD ATPase subunit
VRIKKIELENFRNHAATTLELGDTKFVVIRGPNFAGKSSIGQALSMCLTPSTSGLDAQGRGFARKIKRGASKAVLTTTVQDDQHLIEQTVVLNTNTSGRTGKSVCLDDKGWKPLPFDNFLTRYKDALLVALNTDYFVHRMEEARQISLLAKLALPDHYDFPQDKIDAVNRAIGAGVVDFGGEPFAVIAKAHKKLYDERTDLNRQVRDFKIPEALPEVKGVDSYALQKELEAARDERTTLTANKDAAVKAASAVETKRVRLTTKIDNLLAEVKEGTTKLATVTAGILPADKLKALQETAAKADQLKQLNSDHAGLLATIRAATEQVKKWKIAKDVSTQTPTCPTCEQEINAEKIAGLIAAFEKEHVDADARIQLVDKQIEAMGDVAGAVAAIAKHDAAVKEKAEIEASLTAKVATGKETRTELNALGEAVDPTAAFVQPLADVEVKVNDLMDKLRPAIAAEERGKEITRLQGELADLEKRAAALDELVKYFDSDGIKSKLLAEHVGGFERKINDTMQAWGYTCDLTIEPYDFQVTNRKGDKMAVSELSGAEEVMFSLAFQGAVSRAAGIGFIVADKMDTFLLEERKKANQCLYNMCCAGDPVLEQVIMIIADDNPKVPKLPHAAFFMVNDGNVERLIPAS